MSSKAISAVTDARGLNLSERAVLWRMADQGDDAGYSWLGIDTLAEDLETSKRTIQRLINGDADRRTGLIERGYLEQIYLGGGRGRPALFRVLPWVLDPGVKRRFDARANYEKRFPKGRQSVTLSDPNTVTPSADTVTNHDVKGDVGVTRHSLDTLDTRRIERLEGESWSEALRRNADDEHEHELVTDPS